MTEQQLEPAHTSGRGSYIGLIVGVFLLAEVVVSLILLPPKPEEPIVENFNQCQQAGGVVGESYPEQCWISGDHFVNDERAGSQGVPDGYIGLSERAAFRKASLEDKPARVVEREGRMLPTTMDLQDGRLNFYVLDGAVYRVGVETPRPIE